MSAVPKTVVWASGTLRLLDQTLLPHEEKYLECHDIEAVHAAIRRLSVRGAPAIGIAAAYGLIVGLKPAADTVTLLDELRSRAEFLKRARPTAVNLAWAVDRMCRVATTNANRSPVALIDALEAEAVDIHEEDKASCHAIAEAGLPLVESHPRLLTHCNAGALAVSELGTALAPIYLAHDKGVPVHVYVDETRPLMQGARLTAYELQRGGVDMTLIADNMAASVIASGAVDAVLVGADRIAANGDVANKIGTLNLAVLCHHYGIPFYVACPWSTIDPATPTGADIEIEERLADELTSIAGTTIAPANTPVFNPAFDITPAALVSAVVTDRGIVEPPWEGYFGKT